MEKKTSYAEFSSQLNDKNIIVIELGRQFTRCGFAGEPAPRAIIKSAVINSRGEELFLHDISDRDQLRSCLGRHIEKIYFSQLAVSPKEKKIVIVESVFCKSLFRQVLTNVLFEQFNVPSLLFVPDHLMALATLGRTSGLIVDIGSEEAISIAVVDGVTLLDGTQFASLGAKTLDKFIQCQLALGNPSLIEDLKPSVIEDIRVKTCFVATYERGVRLTEQKMKQTVERRVKSSSLLDITTPIEMDEQYMLATEDGNSPSAVSYPILGHKKITVPGGLREGASEIFFELFGHEHSLTSMIIETVLMAPLDCRRTLAENVLLVGGLSNMPGLEHRLSEELRHFQGVNRFKRNIPKSFKFHKTICPKNYVCWLGASIFCTPTAVELRSTTRDQWIKDGCRNFREWSDLIR